MTRRTLILIFAALLVFSCNNQRKTTGTLTFDPFHYSQQKRIIADSGTVVSAHPLASKVGLQILKNGGNAFDAVIATQLALAVVYPQAGNLGGGGFLVARLADGREIAIDYRETAPGKAHRDMYIDTSGEVRTDKSQYGHLAAGIPGTVAGLIQTAQHGRLSFDQLIAPSIELAEHGFSIGVKEANNLNELQDELKAYNTITPVFVKNGGWKEGDTLRQPDLAATLKRIRDGGSSGFYEGETARLIVDEMKRGGGIITLEDLKNYRAKERRPHAFNYKGYKIISMPMPSSGGVLLHQMMKMIEDRRIGEMGFHSPAAVQLMTEVERRAYADRAEYMGDADHYQVPVELITDDVYLQTRMRTYDSSKATPSSMIKPGALLRTESEETTHISVMDKYGNAVAVTTTLNNSYGSRTVVAGAGFLLNDEMDDFSIKPGVPNMYGAVGGEANAIMPGKRMLSSMTPTIVMKDDKPFLVLGTPGGTTIPTSVFQTIVNIIEFGLTTEDAVYKPKFHHQWLPDSLQVERGFPGEVRDRLRAKGYMISERGQIGRTEIIRVLPNGKFEAVADFRGDDDAEGW